MPISYIQAAEELQLLRGSAGTVQEKIEALRELVESINVEGTGSKTYLYSGNLTSGLASESVIQALTSIDPSIREIKSTQASLWRNRSIYLPTCRRGLAWRS